MSTPTAPAGTLLCVRDLRVGFATDHGVVQAVDGVSFEVAAGEVVAIVGESGCGKSVTAQTVLGLTRGPNTRFDGAIDYAGGDLLEAGEDELRAVRGDEIAMIFQDPMTSLNPVYKIGWQIVEAIQSHEHVDKREARGRAIDLLSRVGIPEAASRIDSYPHEFSGGMRQRAMIAMALACDPRLLIADEPTTALDVTIQAQILRLLAGLRTNLGTAIILITHDLGVVAELADRVLVMYAGMIVEDAPLDQLFADPQHPYTWGLLGSVARVDRPVSKRLPSIAGQPPSLLARPSGCPFQPRCPHAHDACAELPELQARAGDPAHKDRCVLSPADKRTLRIVDGNIGLRPVSREAAA